MNKNKNDTLTSKLNNIKSKLTHFITDNELYEVRASLEYLSEQ